MAQLCFESSLKELGWNPDPDSVYTTGQIIEELGISLDHERLVEAQLKALSVEGPLEELGQGEWRVIRCMNSIDVVRQLYDLMI